MCTFNVLLLEESISNTMKSHVNTHLWADSIHTHSCKTLKPHHSMITAISGDDGVLMSILMSATSLGSQLADNYDRPWYYHNDSSVSTVMNQQ